MASSSLAGIICSWVRCDKAGDCGVGDGCVMTLLMAGMLEGWNMSVLPPSFNRIDIPAYESYEKLYEKLLTAIEETCGFAVEWPSQPLPDSIYTPVSQKALPSLSQDSRNAWNTGNFPFSTLGHWEGKDNFWIFFFNFLNFLFQENKSCGSCHRIIQLLLKTNILNIQNADFSYISTVKQYSILKDYYYFCKR